MTDTQDQNFEDAGRVAPPSAEEPKAIQDTEPVKTETEAVSVVKDATSNKINAVLSPDYKKYESLCGLLNSSSLKTRVRSLPDGTIFFGRDEMAIVSYNINSKDMCTGSSTGPIKDVCAGPQGKIMSLDENNVVSIFNPNLNESQKINLPTLLRGPFVGWLEYPKADLICQTNDKYFATANRRSIIVWEHKPNRRENENWHSILSGGVPPLNMCSLSDKRFATVLESEINIIDIYHVDEWHRKGDKASECTKVLKGNGELSGAIAKLSDKEIVVGRTDGTLMVFDIKTGECLKELKALEESVRDIFIGLNGNIVARDKNGRMLIWPLEETHYIIGPAS